MKTCPTCGNQMEDDAKFCNECGNSIENVAVNPAPAPAPTPNPAPVPAPAPVPGFNGYQQAFLNTDPKDHTNEFDARDINDNKVFGIIPYVFGLLGIIVALLVTNSPYCRFHAKQAAKLEICGVFVFIPVIIPFLGLLATMIGLIILLVVKIIAIVYACQGQAKEIPVISEFKFL